MRETFSSFASEAVDLDRRSGLLAVLESTDSTNSLARRVLNRLGDRGSLVAPMVFLAWHQRRGRGRHDRSWLSDAGQAVLASVVVPVEARAPMSLAPLLTGTALASAIHEMAKIQVMLKWPNDLYVGGAKLGGILVEAITRGASAWLIIGFGINHAAEPPRIQGRETTSLRRERGAAPSLAACAAGLVGAVLAAFERWPAAPEIVDAARQRAYHRAGDELRLETPQGTVVGSYRGLDDTGRLVLETPDGTASYAAGEVIGV